MKMVLKHSNKYFTPIWASRTENKIIAYWDKRFTIAKIPVEEAHFTYPADGDFHYTFYTNLRNKNCVRQFCDRIQFIENGKKVNEVERTMENQVFNMQPTFNTGWIKLPLDQFGGKVVQLILPIFGFGLPFEKSMAKSIFTQEKPKYQEKELIDISNPDNGSFNINFILRGKDTKISENLRFVVEDGAEEPVIDLTLLHILH